MFFFRPTLKPIVNNMISLIQYAAKRPNVVCALAVVSAIRAVNAACHFIYCDGTYDGGGGQMSANWITTETPANVTESCYNTFKGIPQPVYINQSIIINIMESLCDSVLCPCDQGQRGMFSFLLNK
jgi:hypothetical protein